ncbi:deoxyribose-phosphate aldolase [Mucisphaera calidilacus]|uniref:Deoxyribose-phosphate aldolase n=1 Tax=Mucisphaera calidilacus TaxID=2527982 RepID=A0A518BZJ6_9BACT|nr:deoxyribose-phosphate aldolase [Mucisphaera calidilacus]QDU72394.1 Deoxyribose-phosphate aldolase [Mucisphaera calidilacus]
MDLARCIDHTNLNPEAEPAAIDRLVNETIEHDFASACVSGRYVARVAERLDGRTPLTCAVVNFPSGLCKVDVASIEATIACKDGADEIDIVAYIPHLMNADAESARAELSEVIAGARAVRSSVVVKVIVESAYLMKEADAATAEKRIEAACVACRESGADFIKTSTGKHPAGGATMEAIALMKKYGETLKIKAAGGIRTYDDAKRMLDAGADRLGCSSSIAILGQADSAEQA